MFINFSNHPSENWGEAQTKAALEYGEIVDYPFPAVESFWDDEKMQMEIEDCGRKIAALNPAAVLCQGEFVLTFGVVKFLKAHGIKCLSAYSRRESEEVTKPDGSVEKRSIFLFEKFREYL